MQAATIHYVADVTYESRSYSVEISDLGVAKCSCGQVLFDLDTDEQIDRAFRRVARLLTSEQIRAGRRQLGLKQSELALALGVTKSRVSRWENRALVQSRAMDKLLRAYFASNAVRDMLRKIERDDSVGTERIPVNPGGV